MVVNPDSEDQGLLDQRYPLRLLFPASLNFHFPGAKVAHQHTKFKEDGMRLLYRISDAAVGGTSDLARSTQVHYLEGLDISELALLGCIVKAFGLGFWNRLSRNAAEWYVWYESTWSEDPRPLTEDRKMELMVVFEDRLLRFGPHFAWSYHFPNEKQNLEHSWSHQELKKGFEELKAFETGQNPSDASMQSVWAKLFCKRLGCSTDECYDKARYLVVEQILDGEANSPEKLDGHTDDWASFDFGDDLPFEMPKRYWWESKYVRHGEQWLDHR